MRWDRLAWALLGIVSYHYALYPLIVLALARWRRMPPEPAPLAGAPPNLSLVIAAFNEEAVIGAKLSNALGLNYPDGRYEIIIVCDGSTDRTATIVSRCSDPRVKCLHEPARRGKASALNRGVAAASGDIVVLSDANNLYSKDALLQLAAVLADPAVGGVSGAKHIVANSQRAASAGDGLYWRYESMIKQAESRLGGTVTADGEIFALWRRLYAPIPPAVVNDDMFLTLRLVEQGYRIAYHPLAVSTEEASITIADDFNVKVRMIVGGFQSLTMDWRAMTCSGWFAVKMISHKVLRWIMPWILLMLFASCLFSLGAPAMRVLLALQLSGYAAAALGYGLRSRPGGRCFYVPYYFCVMNLAAAFGLVRFLSGSQSILWTKARR
jgi:cellulose synthase/poly-beta-1,6-N-acetylglucosamine synthase-like glycosyltransferase